MILYPNPKINIGLFVVAERADGYHDIETVFYPLHSVTDILEIEPCEEGVSFEVTNMQIGDSCDNLCVKAFRATQGACGFQGGVRMRLTKRIPVGGGLGGGSADAAAVIVALNDMYELGLSVAELKDIALKIGSDVPFFIDNKPAFGCGKGERLTPLPIDLSGKHISLIIPPFSMSTAEAYGAIESRPASYDLRNLVELPLAEWRNFVKNDFEEPFFRKYPVAAAAKAALYAQGADFVLLSGSGSTLYAIGDREYGLSSDFFHC